MSIIFKNTAHLILRGDHIRKDGQQQIYLRLKLSGRKKDMSISEYCPALYWNTKKRQVKRGHPEADRRRKFYR